MKQDLLLYLALPVPILLATTLVASLLQLLNLIDISAQLTASHAHASQFQFLCIMIIIYYAVVTCIAKSSAQICAAKIKILSISQPQHKLTHSSAYGAQTQQKLDQLKQSQEYQELVEGMHRKGEDSSSAKKEGSNKAKSRTHKPVHHHSDSGEDSDHEGEGITCHQMATTKKMF